MDKKLANDHWKYIEGVLATHNENYLVIEKIKFHYISALIHGFKHGVEYATSTETKKEL